MSDTALEYWTTAALIVWVVGLTIAVYFQQKAIGYLIKVNHKLRDEFNGSLGDTIKYFNELRMAFDKLNKISKNSEQVIANLHQHSKTVHEMINSVEQRVSRLEALTKLAFVNQDIEDGKRQRDIG